MTTYVLLIIKILTQLCRIITKSSNKEKREDTHVEETTVLLQEEHVVDGLIKITLGTDPGCFQRLSQNRSDPPTVHVEAALVRYILNHVHC